MKFVTHAVAGYACTKKRCRFFSQFARIATIRYFSIGNLF